MTGVPTVPVKGLSLELVSKTVPKVGTLPGISRVMYDLTSKPPGTTKWELLTNFETAGECHHDYHH